MQVCHLTELKQIMEWERNPNRSRGLCETLLPKNLEKLFREWPAGKIESEIKLLIQEISKPQYLTVYTDGCRQRRVRVGFHYQARRDYHP